MYDASALADDNPTRGEMTTADPRGMPGLLPRGPAATERSLQREIGWHRRRGFGPEAATRAVELGYLLLWRGRLAPSWDAAEQASRLCASAVSACAAVRARVLSGWVRLAQDRVDESVRLFQQALTESAGHRGCWCEAGARVGLARAYVEERRIGDALGVLGDPAAEPPWLGELCGRGRPFCAGGGEATHLAPCHLAAAVADVRIRIAVATGTAETAAGWLDGLRATGPPASAPDRVVLACCDTALAGALGRPRDAAAACASGLRAARANRAALLASELRTVYAAALVTMGRWADADRLVSRLAHGSRSRSARFARQLSDLRRAIDAGRGRPAVASDLASAPLLMADVLPILHACAGNDDSSHMLGECCRAIRSSTKASGVAVFARGRGTALAAVGARVSLSQPARAALTSGPGGEGSIETACELVTFVSTAGSMHGAVAARWPRQPRRDSTRHRALMHAAALMMAPAVRALAFEVRDETGGSGSLADIAGNSPAVVALRRDIAGAASVPFPVLVHGESGSGKELVARSIHAASDRRGRRFCAVNCAALPDELCEAELFGHARGAFTGASVDRAGLFEEADGGTLLLDEVGELSARAQAKLLRVIQEGEVRRLGENAHRRVDSRIIAASNRPLETLVSEGRFRLDLLYRLDVIRIIVPPLRERIEDIPQLAVRIWRHAAARAGSRAELAASALSALTRYDWPGNVRELQNVLSALAAYGPRQGRIGAERLPAHVAGGPLRPATVRTLDAARQAFEQAFVREALARHGNRRAAAATELGITRQGFAKLLVRLGITRDG